MNSQNTPVHIRLWHRDFWLLSLSGLLLSTAIYMLIPTMPKWMFDMEGMKYWETGVAMGIFALGLFICGAFVSFLIQRFRRNVVCIYSIFAVAFLVLLFYYIDQQRSQFVEPWVVFLIRFALGAAFGLAQMVLYSTLVIDSCESYLRTEANHSSTWFSRFALSIGPLAGLVIGRLADFSMVSLVSAGCAMTAAVLIMLVRVPFRSPDDRIPFVSLDRFFLPHGLLLFLFLLLVTTALGLVMSLALTEQFYAMVMTGFLLALIAQRFVFRDAELKSEVVSGLILFVAALLMMLLRSTLHITWYLAPFFVGAGIGIIGARFLLFFIKLSHHCQRGTAQSTFLLGWEAGIALGVGLGLGVFKSASEPVILSALGLLAIALASYHTLHIWFLNNKNR